MSSARGRDAPKQLYGVQNCAMGAEPRLTRRAKEVAELVALGLTNREIASRLFLSDRTVEWHIEQILNKFGFSSRSQIAAWVGRSQVSLALPMPDSRLGSQGSDDSLAVMLPRDGLENDTISGRLGRETRRPLRWRP